MTSDSGTLSAFSDALFELNPMPMWIYDARSLAFLAVNDAAIASYGYTREEFLAMTLLDIRPPEDHEEMRAVAAAHDPSANASRTTTLRRHLRRDGSYTDVEVFSTARVGLGGRLVVLAMIFDVTERDQRINGLRAHQAALEAAQELGDLGSFIFDFRDGTYRLAGSAVRILGRAQVPEAEFAAELRRIARADDASEIRRLVQSLQRREPYEGELQVRDGADTRWIHARTTIVRSNAGVATGVIGVGADITERKRERERLRMLAFTDTETGLPNRTALFETGDGSGAGIAGLLLVQLAWIAAASQRSQHTTARNARAIADQLRRVVPRDAALFRYSDDTFALALPGGKRFRAPATLAKRIRAAFERPLNANGDDVVVTTAIGIAAGEGSVCDVAELARRAEAALQETARGESRTVTYSAELERAHNRRATIERNLRHAIADHRVGVVYQPIVSLQSGRILGAEALMRWDCPDIGPVPPDEFIALAEESGAILPLGEWILREACAQTRRWEIEGLGAIRIAVNVSARQVQQREFVRLVSSVCEMTGLAPAQLELELTERTMMHRDGFAMRNLEAIRRLGVSIAIDDFGTGYSALSYLRALPLDKLKLDRAFVAQIAGDPFQADITGMVIDLAHRHTLCVVGEAVETLEQVEALRAMGCDEAQGFLFGRPMASSEFAALLGRERLTTVFAEAPAPSG